MYVCNWLLNGLKYIRTSKKKLILCLNIQDCMENIHVHIILTTGTALTIHLDTVYCFCFAVKKFHSLTSFLSFPEKLSRLPVTGTAYLRHS